MATKFIIKDGNSGFYLGKKVIKGYYLTTSLIEALRCESEQEAEKHASKQKMISESAITITKAEFH